MKFYDVTSNLKDKPEIIQTGWMTNDVKTSEKSNNSLQFLHLCGRSVNKQTQSIDSWSSIDWEDLNKPKSIVRYSPSHVNINEIECDTEYIKEELE